MKKNRNDFNIIGKLSAILTGMGAAVLVFAAFCAGLVAFAAATGSSTNNRLLLTELPSAYASKVTAGSELAKEDLNGLKYELRSTEHTVTTADISSFRQTDSKGSCEMTLTGGEKLSVLVDSNNDVAYTFREAVLCLQDGDSSLYSNNYKRIPKKDYAFVDDAPYQYAVKESDKTAWIIYYCSADNDSGSESGTQNGSSSEVTGNTSEVTGNTSEVTGNTSEVTGNTSEVTGNAGQTVVLPDIAIESPVRLNGKNYNVVGIDNFAFVYSQIGSFTGPDTLETVGDYAFSSCTGLKSVDLSATDKNLSLGYGAFISCSELESVTLPDTLESIGDEAFYHCDKLKNITVPPFVNDIYGDETFPAGARITGASGSAAQKYCEANSGKNYTFIPNDREVIPVSVTYKGSDAELTIYDADDTAVSDPITVPYSANGGCCYLDPETLEDGETYKLVVSKPGYTEFTVTGLKKDRNTIPEDKIKIYPGNLPVNGGDPDGEVQLDDIAELSKVYGQGADDDDYLEDADFNGDGIIDMKDVTLLINSGGYNKKSGSYAITA